MLACDKTPTEAHYQNVIHVKWANYISSSCNLLYCISTKNYESW